MLGPVPLAKRLQEIQMQEPPCNHYPVRVNPLGKVAFDLVGPLPKSASGFRYILTMMDLFSKYPEAIPLKRVDNISVLAQKYFRGMVCLRFC